MDNKDRIDIMREGWGDAITALEKCRIFLTALTENPWLGRQPAQIRELLSDVQIACKQAETYFKPEIINAE